eukprot:265062_1
MDIDSDSLNAAHIIDHNPPTHTFNASDNIIKPPFGINNPFNYFLDGAKPITVIPGNTVRFNPIIDIIDDADTVDDNVDDDDDNDFYVSDIQMLDINASEFT